MRQIKIVAIACALALNIATAHAAGNLRVGLNEDPDSLDPARAGSYVGRIVFAAMCDKLVDIDSKLAIVPQLATSWSWSADNLALTLKLRPGVTFQDGEAFDATAVGVNIDRYRTASYSLRKGELAAVKSVEVVDPLTVILHLSTPNAPLLAVLADRAGMMLSPKALATYGDQIADHAACAGPFKLVERVAQDHITLERFSNYWDAKNVFLDRITYRPIPNTAIKLVNLVSGQLDLIERMAASDAPAVKKNADLQLLTQPALAYQAVLFNIDKGPAAKTPFGMDKRVRRAFEMSIDRAAINQVAFEGTQTPSNQFEAPNTPYWDPAFPVRPRDVEGAKKLLREAGLTRVPLTLQVDNSPVSVQVGELVQSMAAEAGFDVKILAAETNSAVSAAKAGEFQAYIVNWSGRADPDGNSSVWLSKNGFLNWGNYQNPEYDALLSKAREITDLAQRKPLYAKADAIFQQDAPMVVLLHQTWLFAASKKLSGLNLVPDGLIRPQGIKLAD
jgi:peptide/nickel transport system substrate-binding protein